MFGFLDVPVEGAYHLIHARTGPLSTPLAIVVFTPGVRLLLHPLARSAARGERNRLLPEIRALQEKHGRTRHTRRVTRRLVVHNSVGLWTTGASAGLVPDFRRGASIRWKRGQPPGRAGRAGRAVLGARRSSAARSCS
ncbi:hypothetical protein [Amycolatopsis tolypomycina]|uniref:hypothetical protein n=1 Tax=Amycolatopsis tolypomycina TaxID=208445 RepID=UPI0033B77318